MKIPGVCPHCDADLEIEQYDGVVRCWHCGQLCEARHDCDCEPPYDGPCSDYVVPGDECETAPKPQTQDVMSAGVVTPATITKALAARGITGVDVSWDEERRGIALRARPIAPMTISIREVKA